jgi:hypothetical protein
MSPILLRCVGLRLLKLLALAVLLAGVLMLGEHRLVAQGGKDEPSDAGKKDAGEKDDNGQKMEAGEGDGKAEAEEPEEPGTDEEEPGAVVDTGGYLTLTADAEKKGKEAQVRQILKKGTFEGAEQAEFDDYFKNYFFRSWADPSFISKVTDQRARLRNLFQQSRGAAVHDHLLAISLGFLKILAEKNFHPASRYNGMLAIGELNETEQSGANVAVPYASALPVLLQTLKSGPTDALRVAALRGLLRHCKEGKEGIASSQTRDTEVIPTLLELAKSRPPKGRSPDGHAWMRVLAIQALAELGVAGAANVAAVGPSGVIDAMVAIVGDPASPLPVRCAAVRALGSIPPGPKAATTPAKLAVLVRQLTADSCDHELSRQKKDSDTPFFRREVRQQLNDVKKALDDYPGLKVADPDLSAEVRSLIAKLDAKEKTDDAMIKDTEESVRRLRSVLPAAAASKPRAAAGAP